MDSLAVSSVDMRIVRSCLTRMCLHVWLLFAHFVIERMCDLSDKLHVNTNDYWWVSESLPLCRNIFQSAYKSFFILSNLYSLCAAFDGWVDLVGEIKKKGSVSSSPGQCRCSFSTNRATDGMSAPPQQGVLRLFTLPVDGKFSPLVLWYWILFRRLW